MNRIFDTLPRRICFYAAFIAVWAVLSVKFSYPDENRKWDGLAAAHPGGGYWENWTREDLFSFTMCVFVLLSAATAFVALAQTDNQDVVESRRSEPTYDIPPSMRYYFPLLLCIVALVAIISPDSDIPSEAPRLINKQIGNPAGALLGASALGGALAVPALLSKWMCWMKKRYA